MNLTILHWFAAFQGIQETETHHNRTDCMKGLGLKLYNKVCTRLAHTVGKTFKIVFHFAHTIGKSFKMAFHFAYTIGEV